MPGSSLRLVVSALSALWISACAPAVTGAAPETRAPRVERIEAGGRLAELHCAGCHAIGASGESANPAAPPLRTLSERYPVDSLEEALAEGILTGHPAMPEFRFEPAQIDAFIDYLNAIQERRAG